MQAHSTPLARPAFELGGFFRHFAGVGRAFRWALEMRRRCDRWEASGRKLDGQVLARIAEGVERELGSG